MSDSQSGDQFDRDDQLRELLRGGDTAGSLSPADPAALAILLEDIMSADLDVRPAAEGSRETGTHRRNPLTWLVAAAAVAAIAAGGAFAVNGLSDRGSQDTQAGPETSVTDVGAGTAGVTTTLGVADQQGRCAAATPEILAQYPLAFQGTVTAIEGDTVTLDTTEVLAGDVGETVEVTAAQGLGAALGTVGFQVGDDYLVAAFDGQISQCYSGSATGDLQSPFEKAFVR